MKRHAAFLITITCALSQFAPPAWTQGVWDELQKRSVEHILPPPPEKSRQELCVEYNRVQGTPKCRGYYLENGFVTKWKGLDSSASHGLYVEVLIREPDAVLCYNVTLDLDHFSPCMLLFDANNLPTRLR